MKKAVRGLGQTDKKTPVVLSAGKVLLTRGLAETLTSTSQRSVEPVSFAFMGTCPCDNCPHAQDCTPERCEEYRAWFYG